MLIFENYAMLFTYSSHTRARTLMWPRDEQWTDLRPQLVVASIAVKGC